MYFLEYFFLSLSMSVFRSASLPECLFACNLTSLSMPAGSDMEPCAKQSSLGVHAGGTGLPSLHPLPVGEPPDSIARGCEHLKLITSSALDGGELWSSPSLPLTMTPITAPALL